MDTLAKQVRRAHFRLLVQDFLAAAGWCCFVTISCAAVLIAVDKFRPLGILPWAWLACAAAVGAAIALGWTIFRRGEPLDAAIEIDRRFGLKERVSSSLSLLPQERDTEIGRALVADALGRVEKIDVADRFQLSLGRWSWLPLVPAALAAMLIVMLPQVDPRQSVEASPENILKAKQIKKTEAALKKKLAKRADEAAKKGLKDAENLFAKLEKGTKDISKGDMKDQKQALVKLNDLAKELDQRRRELGSSDKLKQQLNQLKEMSKGPADKLGQALKAGDLKQAMKEIEDLKQQLSQGKLDKQAQQELSKQLTEMRDKLKQVADAHQKAKEALAEQIKQKQQAGKKSEANELQKQLEQLAQQDQQMQQMRKMAEKLGQCAECMKQGKSEEAMAGLEEMKSELQSLQKQMDEMAMLDEAMDEIDAAKDMMRGGSGRGGKRSGDGLGEGRGQGDRPEERTGTGFYDSKVKQKQDRGAAVVTGFADGPNVRGKVEAEIQTQFEAARAESSDPLTGQTLPREYRDHAKKYFDSLREGE